MMFSGSGYEAAKIESRVAAGAYTKNCEGYQISEVQVLERFPVLSSLISKYSPDIESISETIIRKIPGLAIEEAKFENNLIHFEGSLPDSEITR